MKFEKLKKAVADPRWALSRAARKTWLASSQMNPTSVSEKQVQKFFKGLETENKALLEPLKPLIQSSKVVFDVGANSGYFSKVLIEGGFNGKLILFEPIANLLGIALKTLQPFNIEKIFVNAALGESEGEIDLYLPGDSNIGWITALKEKATTQKKITAKVVATSKYIEQYKPDFVKIDVEGFEVFVLRPFLEFIDRDYSPTFLVEIGWGQSNPHWNDFVILARELNQKGYEFFEPAKGMDKVTLEELEKISSTTDLVFSRRSGSQGL